MGDKDGVSVSTKRVHSSQENDMGTKFDKSITLSGEESINFANSLFRPTKEQIEEKKKILDKIDSLIAITKTEDGFEAEIKEE